MTPCLLTLIATPELEEKLIDWLLEEGHEGFTSLPCHGHGTNHDRLSAAEQVAGRQQQVAFWLQLSSTIAADLVHKLAVEFQGAQLHYWIVPVSAGGPVASARGQNNASNRGAARRES